MSEILNQVGQLDPVLVAALTDILAVRQSGDPKDKRETLQQILDLFNANTSIGDLNDVTISSPVDGEILVFSGGGLVNAANTAGRDPYVLVSDTKAQNAAGGTFTAGAWRTRDINTEDVDTGNLCSVAANQITLDAGTYRFRIACPAYDVGRHQARLYNITGSSVIKDGASMFSSAGTPASVDVSLIVGRVTLAVQTVLEIQHRCETTSGSVSGFGVACNFAAETYTIAEFWKER